MKRVNYHLTEQQIEQLHNISQETGLTVAEIIRRAVDAHVNVYNTRHVSQRRAGKDRIGNGE